MRAASALTHLVVKGVDGFHVAGVRTPPCSGFSQNPSAVRSAVSRSARLSRARLSGPGSFLSLSSRSNSAFTSTAAPHAPRSTWRRRRRLHNTAGVACGRACSRPPKAADSRTRLCRVDAPCGGRRYLACLVYFVSY